MDYDVEGIEIGGPRWRKSSFSDENEAACVEVAERSDGGRSVRDSKDPDGGMLTFTSTEWTAFVQGVTAGEFS